MLRPTTPPIIPSTAARGSAINRQKTPSIANKNTIPATVRNLTDAEAHELRLIENLQRTNIHELDEGIGYRSLMALRPDFYTVETMAVHVAKSPAYVKGRLSLTELIPAAQTAFYDGRVTVAHALAIARLQSRDQERALMECFPGHRSTGSILKDRKAEALTVRQLREWIEARSCIEQDASNLIRERCSSRLLRDHRLRQPGGQTTELRRLSRSLDAFEGDEHGLL